MKFVLVLICTFCLVSCSHEDEYFFEGDLVPAVFTPSFAGDLEADDNSDEHPGTRATNNTWTSGDKVGIYMLNGSNYSLTSALKKNEEYYAVSGGTSTTLSPVASSNTIFYPVNGNTVRFVAYSPYSSAATSANQVTYTFTTQNTKATKEGKDFIFYRGTTNRSKTSPTENMTFKHKFCKINITVKQGTGGPSCSGLTMKLTKMPASATVNLATLASSATNENSVTGLGISTSSTTISAYTNSSSTTSASVEAIVAPHTGSGNFTGRTFTFSSGALTYNLPDNVTFESGKVYNFEFTLTQKEAVFNELNISDSSIGGAAWNNDYALITSVGSLDFGNGYSSQTVTIRTKGTTKKPTSSRSTSATTITGSPTWITTYSLGTGITSGDWTSYTLTVGVSTNNSTTVRTPAYVHLDVEGLKVVITVNQSGATKVKAASVDGMSNCYIVAPGGTVTFSVTRAYTGGVLSSNYTGNFGVEVLWDDGNVISSATVSGKGTAAMITVNTNSGYKGNALVALRAGEIVWSYHIWVVNMDLSNTWDPKNEGGTTINPRTTFMDRNLGVEDPHGVTERHGMYYQWGRKDPFPYFDDYAYYGTNTGPFSLEESIRYPNVFATGNANKNWLNEINTFLWVTENDEKTIYDPCPSGWRLPTAGDEYEMFPWAGLYAIPWNASPTGGIYWGSNHWPASGYKQSYDGSVLQDWGYQMMYWTSKGDANRGHVMKCYRTDPATSPVGWNYLEPAYGASVRCVADN